jgi:hypothetical protein
MNLHMGSLRLVLILLLAALMDLGCPVLPEVGEAAEEFEEAAHGRRRMPSLVLGTSPASTPAPATTVTIQSSRPALRRPPARAIAAPIRKTPPPLSDPPSAPDDH